MNNPLIVRHCEGSYHDPDWVAFHSVFTCLIHYIEEERGGPDSFREYLKDILMVAARDWKFPAYQERYADREAFLRERLEPHRASLALYEWYLGCDWTDSQWLNRGFHDEASEKLRQVADVIWSWWT